MDEKQHTAPANASTPAQPAARPAHASQPKAYGVGGAQNARDNRQGGGPRGGSGRGGGGRGGSGRGGGKGGDRQGGRGRGERVRPEFDQKSIDVRRVARVVAGGRRFSFSVAMIAGDRKGKVGVGTGKAGDISMAMDKAAKDAKKHMITLRLTKKGSIPHRVMAKSSSATVEITPAPSRGLVAGSAVRNVLELAGVTDVNAKIWSGSKNRLNMARATIKALQDLRPRAQAAKAPEAEAVKELKPEN